MKYILIVSVVLSLSACKTTEIPNNDQPGSDQMKLSPCACIQIPYRAKGLL